MTKHSTIINICLFVDILIVLIIIIIIFFTEFISFS